MKGSLLCLLQKQAPDLICTKSVFKNFAKFTGKQLCQSLFFNKATKQITVSLALNGYYPADIGRKLNVHKTSCSVPTE